MACVYDSVTGRPVQETPTPFPKQRNKTRAFHLGFDHYVWAGIIQRNATYRDVLMRRYYQQPALRLAFVRGWNAAQGEMRAPV